MSVRNSNVKKSSFFYSEEKYFKSYIRNIVCLQNDRIISLLPSVNEFKVTGYMTYTAPNDKCTFEKNNRNSFVNINTFKNHLLRNY